MVTPSASTRPVLRRLSAFTLDPAGGNPAGVWIGSTLPDAADMQRIAAEVGYSETAFLAPADDGRWTTRYYSPEAEVSFCGHATIATGVALGERHGPGTFLLETAVGEVPVEVVELDGRLRASLTSVGTRHRPAEAGLLTEVLDTLGWDASTLDPELPPVVAYAGAWHLVLAVAERATLDRMDYDFDRLKARMLAEDLTTIQIVWREAPDVFHSRNPFPVGGVVEDPATGAAAAALGGYLRDAGLLKAPAWFVIRQGEAMGRPSRLEVEVPREGGIVVSGTAVDCSEEP